MTIEEFKNALAQLVNDAAASGLAIAEIKDALTDEAFAAEGELMRSELRRED